MARHRSLAAPPAWHRSPHPTAPPARHRSLLPSLRHTKVGIPTSLSHRGRNSDFTFCPKNPSPGHRRRCVSDAVLAALLMVCFFSPFTRPAVNPGVTGLPHSILAWAQDCHTQSWRGHRIAPLNPRVGTRLPHSILAWAQDCHTQSWRGLPHSILAWAQDCHTQSWRGHRIATLNPGVGTGLPRCFPENAGSAVLYSTTPPDSPPGLRGKKPAVRRFTAMHSRTRRPDCPQNYGSALLYSRTLPEKKPAAMP